MGAVPPTRDAPRLYHPQLPHPRLAERPALLDPEQTRHAKRVLRCGEGDRVELFDGEGGLATAIIAGFDGPRALCRVEHLEHHDPPTPRITIAAALPKGTRPDEMVDQLSQLGADRLVPITTERSTVNPRSQKLERLGRQAVEAAKQCGRLHLLQIEPVHSLSDALADPADLRLIAAMDAKPWSLEPQLAAATSVQVLIGPEGGWTEAELATAERAGARRWSFGKHVLRIETAASAAAAVLRYLSQPQG